MMERLWTAWYRRKLAVSEWWVKATHRNERTEPIPNGVDACPPYHCLGLTDCDGVRCTAGDANPRGCTDPACRGGVVQYPEWEGETQPCPMCNPQVSDA